ncbi:hypothetical protein U1Q18_014444 [Sarracenia purpurea var. burkii]
MKVVCLLDRESSRTDKDFDMNNRFIAVELDTFKEDFDPNANHVGLNINTVRSNTTTSLTPLEIKLTPVEKASFFNAWVQYDGIAKTIKFTLRNKTTSWGPPLRCRGRRF